MQLADSVFINAIRDIDHRIAELTQARALLAYEMNPTVNKPKLTLVGNYKAKVTLGHDKPKRKFSPEGLAKLKAGQAKRWRKYKATKRAFANSATGSGA